MGFGADTLGMAVPTFKGTPVEVDNAINNIQKAITEVSVSGLALVREDLQSELAIAAPIDTPLRNRLSRIPGNGSSHAWYRLEKTVTSEGNFLGTGPADAFYAKGGLPTATQASYKRISAPYVSLGDIAEVTFFDLMKSGRSKSSLKCGDICVSIGPLVSQEKANGAGNPQVRRGNKPYFMRGTRKVWSNSINSRNNFSPSTSETYTAACSYKRTDGKVRSL